MKKRYYLWIWRVLLAFLACLGTALEIIKYGFGMLMYYTVLSNLLVAVFCLYILYAMKRQRDLQKPSFLRIKAGVTLSILITFVIYHTMLAPLATDFWRLENILCHYIVPLSFFLDTLALDRQGQYRWYDPFYWTSLPLLYLVFALFNGLVMKLPIPDATDSPFPYFFLNVTTYGWRFVLTYCSFIFLGYLIVSYLFLAVKSIRFSKLTKKES